MFYSTDDLRIKWIKVVLPPVFLEEELPTRKSFGDHFKAREKSPEDSARRRPAAAGGRGSVLDS